MRVDWYGQSAFRLEAGDTSVVIDPFGDLSAATAGRLRFEYPPIPDTDASLVLVTHEHGDHNAVEAVGGTPHVVRSTAGRLPTPIGDVLAIASEHDAVAGTERGPNAIFVFELDGLRVAHFGDLGQRALREEQVAAIGTVDLIFLPVGGGPTIGADQAAEIVERLGPRWVVPMHYRTHRIDFLEPIDAFLELAPDVEQVPRSTFATEQLPAANGPLIVVPAAP